MLAILEGINYKTPLAARPRIEPIPNTCPRQFAATTDPWLSPPKY